MNQEVKREIIIDNYNNPFNKGLKEDLTYLKFRTNNESCIDDITLMYKIEDDIIKDICFDGEACAISTSATSIMIKELIGKTKQEAINILDNYMNMLNEKEYDENILGELVVYSDISKQPNRLKCAMLPFESLKKVIEKM